MSDEEEYYNDDQVIPGEPLPNTLETTLDIFPLAETRGVKRKRTVIQSQHDNNDQSLTKQDIKEILFPTDTDLLGDTMDRMTFPKRRKTTSSSQPSILSQRLNSILNNISFGKPGKSRLARQIQGQLITGATAKKPSRLATLTMMPVKTYSYMVPNEFNVRMVTPYTLYPHQKRAIQWMVEREEGKVRNQYYKPGMNGCMLAMVMGLGKTLCVGSLVVRTLNLQHIERSCSLYVAPKNLLGTVRNEFEKFFGDQIKILVYHRDFLRSAYGTFNEQDIRQYDVIITNYETVVSRMESAKKFSRDKSDVPNQAALSFCNFSWFRIILDECQDIRTCNTKRFKSMYMLNSSRRICMTGTPIHNHIRDLFNEMKFTGFVMPKGVKCTKEAVRTCGLRDMILFVEYKDVQEVKLPEKHINKIYFDLSPNERFLHRYYIKNAKRVYHEMEREQGRGKMKKSAEAQVSMLRVLQVCTAPYIITPTAKVEYGSEDMMSVAPAVVFPMDNEIDQWIRNRSGDAGIHSSKMRKLVELWQEFKQSSSSQNPLKVVVFANFTSSLRLAISALENAIPDFQEQHVFVHGDITSTKKREVLFTRFRTQPHVEALFMTLKLGSIGLNLSEADKVIILEPWYAYSALHQAEGRVHRIGQIRPVNVYYFVGKDSVEERVYRIAQSKKELAEDVSNIRDHKLEHKDMQFILFNDMEIEEDV